MTAINVVLKPDRAVMMTDAAMYLPSGLVVAFGQKAFALPTLNAAIACRGGQMQTAILAIELPARFRTVDEMTRGDAFATACIGILAGHTEKFAWADVEIVLVGWSAERDEAVGLYFSSVTRSAEEIDEHAFGPMLSDEEDANLHRIGCEMDVDVTAAGFDPIRHGIPIMEAQRRMRISGRGMETDEELHIVGGHILLTEVGREGVTQRVVHRWADEAGENIQPAIFTAPQLSRQQRRAAERMARA